MYTSTTSTVEFIGGPFDGEVHCVSDDQTIAAVILYEGEEYWMENGNIPTMTFTFKHGSLM